ncbi:7499_t:CDS:2 [Paraglomus brasilianum]|uniref:7499_t:CDS:1 n=1 Tax=Paraglomus brasilianum TaxID=144538 RepID=A0A9N8VNJ7_9GLOM|nr:7499_t:CDS:2 [Paraglomus brasilianum]
MVLSLNPLLKMEVEALGSDVMYTPETFFITAPSLSYVCLCDSTVRKVHERMVEEINLDMYSNVIEQIENINPGLFEKDIFLGKKKSTKNKAEKRLIENAISSRPPPSPSLSTSHPLPSSLPPPYGDFKEKKETRDLATQINIKLS